MRTLELPAIMENYEKMVEFVRNEASKEGFDEETVGQIHLAFEEAVVNVINYAYSKTVGTVEIRCDSLHERGGMKIEIIDGGKPFDPLAKEDPDILLPVDERPIGGLGVFMVKKIMDEVFYRRENQKNIFTMLKYLSNHQ